MCKIVLPITLLTVAGFLLPAAPAHAQANHTFVSAAGSDSNNCASVTTPCRHFANAYAATAPNGEIFVLDPANYGALTITGPVSIEGHGWASLAAVSGGAAITVNANPSDKINIIGVVLDGINIANTTGIQFNIGGSLTVRDSVIRNFTQDGIVFNNNASTPGHLVVSNTLASDNNIGIFILAGPNATTTVGVLDHVVMENNSNGDGLHVRNTGFSNTMNVTVSDSVSANNGDAGIYADSQNGAPINIMVRNSTIANNSIDGLSAIASGETILVTRSTITGNSTGWAGTVLSYGDNNIDGNTNVNTEPPNPLVYH